MNTPPEETNDGTSPRPIDVFISYRRFDGGFEAAALEKALRDRGVSVFRDKSDIGNGEEFPEAIRNAIHSAREIVLVCTPRYFGPDRTGHIRILDECDWCRKELEQALDEKKTILPVSEAGCFPPDRENLPDSLTKLLDLNITEKTNDLTEDRLPKAVDALFERFSEQTQTNSRRNVWEDRLSALDPNARSGSIDYNVAIRNLVIEKCYGCNEEVVRKSILPLVGNGGDATLRFSAFYAAYTFYRRMGNTEALLALVEDNKDKAEFASIAFLQVALTQYHRLKHDKESDPEEMEKALACAKTAMEKIEGNAGVLLSYAELIADAATVHRDRFLPRVDEALEVIGSAMKRFQGYPKQFCVRGRLLMLQKRYREAIKDFRQAIDLENSEKKDAFLRMLQYQGFLQDAKLLQMEERLTEKFSASGRRTPQNPS